MEGCAPQDVCTSIITVQERTQGWLAVVNKPRSVSQLIWAYGKLEAVCRNFTKLPVLSYTQAAPDRVDDLTRQRLRLGTMDLRVAAIVLVNDATLLSGNLRDFGRVPGLRVED